MKTTPTYQVSFVVPILNGAGTLEELTERTILVASSRGSEFEVILVDDGSADESWEKIRLLSRRHSRVRGLRLARNIGQHAATLVGVLEARFPVLVTLDDDGEYPPEQIPRLLEELDRGHDLVYGILPGSHKSWTRRVLSRLAHQLIDPATRSGRSCSSFRAFKRNEILCQPLRSSGWHTLDSLFNLTVEKISTIPLVSPPGRPNPSRYGWARLTELFVRGLVGVTQVRVPQFFVGSFWGLGLLGGMALWSEREALALVFWGGALLPYLLFREGNTRARELALVPHLRFQWVGERVGV